MKVSLAFLFVVFANQSSAQTATVLSISGKEWYCLKSCGKTNTILPGDGALSNYFFKVTFSKDKTYFWQGRNNDTGVHGTFTIDKGVLTLRNAATKTPYSVEFQYGNYLCLKKGTCYYYLVAK